jgi:uncharacterized protein HemX
MSAPTGGDDEPERSGRANLAGVIAVIILIALGYLAFNFIEQQRKLQNCLDSGRRDCAQIMNSGK